MTWMQVLSVLESAAQIALERALNSLPEGILIAVFAWLLLRLIGRQNAGTRFAVWITTLVAVAGLPFLSSLDSLIHLGPSLLPAGYLHPQITVPLFWVVPICTVWAIGVCVAIARIVAGLWQVRMIRRSCTAIDPDQLDASLREPVLRALADSGVSRTIIIAETDQVRVPSAIGLCKPMIVFPSWTLHGLSPDELYVILIHELAHLRRRDDWTNLLQKIVRGIFFFHPAVWWIDAKLSLEREMACDDAVLAKTGNPRVYANCLVRLLEETCARRGWAMAQAAVHRVHEASLRIAQILDPFRPTTTRVWKIAPVLAGAFSVVCIGGLLCAPRLVVFMPAAKALNAGAAETSIAGQTNDRVVSAAMVVPAALHFPEPASHTIQAKRTVVRPGKHAVRHGAPGLVRTSTHSARMSEGPSTKVVMAKAEQNSAAPILVLVQATENDIDGMVWRIQVWRVLWTSPAPLQQRNEVLGSSI